MNWLQGGPFLEVSFVLPLGSDKKDFVSNVLAGFQQIPSNVQVAIAVIDLEKLVEDFVQGNPHDDKDHRSLINHTAQIPLLVDICGTRRSILHVSGISESLAVVDLWFYGSELDAEEWGQKGVSEDQEIAFKKLLMHLYEQFHFPIGSVGYEMNALELFDSNSGWPDESYNLANINTELFPAKLEHSLFMILLDRKTFGIGGQEDSLVYERSSKVERSATNGSPTIE